MAGVAIQADFPITAGAIQAQFFPGNDTFVAKLDPTGSNLLFSTFYGSINGSPSPPRLDGQGNLWITETATDTASGSLAPSSLELGVGVVAELAADGSSVVFSELIPNGMAGRDLVLNGDGTLTAVGVNGSLLRQPRGTPTEVSILGVADNAGTVVVKSIAPGEYLSIYGSRLGPASGVGLQIGPDGRLSSSLAGTQVTIGGVPAPLLYVSANQINALVPYETAVGSTMDLQVTTSAGQSSVLPLNVVRAQPNIFGVLNGDGSINSQSNPAPAGGTVSVLVSGAGALNMSVADGAIASSPAPAPALPADVMVSWGLGGFLGGFGQQAVHPAYAASVPGSVVNMLRVNVPMPDLPCTACRLAVILGSAPSPTSASYGVSSPSVVLYLAGHSN